MKIMTSFIMQNLKDMCLVEEMSKMIRLKGKLEKEQTFWTGQELTSFTRNIQKSVKNNVTQ